MHKTSLTAALLLALGTLGACGPADNSPDELPPTTPSTDDDDVSGGGDGEQQVDDDYGPTKCVFRDLEDRGQIEIGDDDMYAFYSESLGYWLVTITLENGVYLDLDLHPGKGSLAGGLAPGVYPIQNKDTIPEDCALCATIRDVRNDPPFGRYVAKVGALEITEIDPETDVFHGRLTELGMEAYDTTHIIGPSCSAHDQCGNNTCFTSFKGGGRCYVSVPHPNRCPVSIGSIAF